MKRRKLSKSERQTVYDKMHGHCAYCGIELQIKDMQVDHIVPLYWYGGADEIENMYPACRSCNHYKSAYTLENFRSALENMPNVLERDNVTYRNAVRYGLISRNKESVKFYFEQLLEGL